MAASEGRWCSCAWECECVCKQQTLPTDLIENIWQHQACKIILTHSMLHHRRTETKAVSFVEDVQESHSLRTEAMSAVYSVFFFFFSLFQYSSLSSEQTPLLSTVTDALWMDGSPAAEPSCPGPSTNQTTCQSTKLADRKLLSNSPSAARSSAHTFSSWLLSFWRNKQWPSVLCRYISLIK